MRGCKDYNREAFVVERAGQSLSDAPLLRVTDLRTSFFTSDGEIRAVDGVSFDISDGETVGLVGESGCGKTTAVRAVMGVLAENGRRAGGQVRFKDQPIDEKSTRPLLWREIAYVPQSAMSSLDPVYTVGAQIVEVLTKRGGASRSAAKARAAELFELVGLSDRRLADYPHQFSGGMRQRAAIAMALALEPSLLLADEPVTALDVIVQRQILDMLRALQQRLKLSMVMVTHDISVVAYLCDEVVVMYAGQVVESGPVREVLGRPRHPYTMGLRNAFPDLLSDAMELVPIHGSPPDLRGDLTGCRFAPRCPFVQAACTTGPIAADITDDHLTACRRSSEAETLRTAALDPKTWQRV
jgi:peptide/nickel transport system ATP-binding protein